MIIRQAVVEDANSVFGLYRQLHAHDVAVEESAARKMFQRVVESVDNLLFVVEIDECVVGTCYLNVIPNLTRGLRPYAILENVVSDKSCRGQGVGKSMVQYAIQKAWDLNCYKVMLQLGDDDGLSQFYRSCGFVSENRRAFMARNI